MDAKWNGKLTRIYAAHMQPLRGLCNTSHMHSHIHALMGGGCHTKCWHAHQKRHSTQPFTHVHMHHPSGAIWGSVYFPRSWRIESPAVPLVDDLLRLLIHSSSRGWRSQLMDITHFLWKCEKKFLLVDIQTPVVATNIIHQHLQYRTHTIHIQTECGHWCRYFTF